MQKAKFSRVMPLLLAAVLLFVSCGDSTGSDTSTKPEVESIQTATALPNLPEQTLAPLPATNTPAAHSIEQDPSSQPASTIEVLTPSPTVDLNQPVLTLTYEIPAIQLDRRLEANLAGKITLIDVTSGREETVPNGQRLLTEINGALQTFKNEFQEVPTDCPSCVIIGFELPAAGESGKGILENPQLQVSIQHLFSTRLGPHFPPDSVMGHHYSASGYTMAQTAALTEDGTLYRWIAADPQIEILQDQKLLDDNTLNEYQNILQDFSSFNLVTDCVNFPVEFINFKGDVLQIRCPELALPNDLIQPYTAALELLEPLLADDRNLEIPQTRLPFGARVFYEQKSGNRVTIFEDGSVEAQFIITSTVTTTETQPVTFESVNSSIPAGEIDPLIIPMLASGVIPRGVRVSVSNEQTDFEELILIRALDGVYELAWSNNVGQELIPGIQILDLLIEELSPSN